MYSRDFTKEIGMHTEVKTVPLKVAIPLLATLATSAWFGLVQTGADTRNTLLPDKTKFAAMPPGDAVANR